MGPKVLRQQTRSSAASLPSTLQSKFLCDAAKITSSISPHLGAWMGRKSMESASGHHGALSRQEIKSLCQHCGAPLALESDGAAIRLSRNARRRVRRRNAKLSAAKKSVTELPASLVMITCDLCGDVARQLPQSLRAGPQR